MEYNYFLKRAINEGIGAAKADYPWKKNKDKREGSIAGFEACRDKQPLELLELYKEACEYANRAFVEQAEDYWWFRCYQLEVEWICNVVSAVMVNEGKPPILSHLPTCRGVMQAASILNSYAH